MWIESGRSGTDCRTVRKLSVCARSTRPEGSECGSLEVIATTGENADDRIPRAFCPTRRSCAWVLTQLLNPGPQEFYWAGMGLLRERKGSWSPKGCGEQSERLPPHLLQRSVSELEVEGKLQLPWGTRFIWSSERPKG